MPSPGTFSLWDKGVFINLEKVEGFKIEDFCLVLLARKNQQEHALYALKYNKILPVLTDDLNLPIGGTLSLAGFGSSS